VKFLLCFVKINIHIMKKSTLFVLVALVGISVMLTSCGGDDPADKTLEIVLDGESFSLENGSLYFTTESTTDAGSGGTPTHTFRQYYISDGSWNGEGFTDASFYFLIQLTVPLGEDFAGGNYPSDLLRADSDGSKISYLSFENNSYGFVSLGNSDDDVVKVSGGFDDDEVMIIFFNGPVDGNVDEVKFYFKGAVSDVRPL